MEASLVTRRVLARADVRGWAWWQLPWLLKCYVGLVPTVAAALTCLAAVNTTWHVADLGKFALLLGCGQPGPAAVELAATAGASAEFRGRRPAAAKGPG